MPPLPIEAYQVGWVCALPKELTAARAMLDEEHEEFKSQAAQDDNSYVLGRIYNHNVVLACLPAGVYGTVSAATVASNMLRTFTGIRCGLMVGIGGGIPNLSKGVDIRLGDVVVSQPDETYSGVVQYDLGKNLGEGILERKGVLRPPPKLLLTALANLQSRYPIYGSEISDILSDMIQRLPQMDKAGYIYPTLEVDVLHCSNIKAHQDARICTQCQSGVVRRPLRENQSPDVHYGVIASGNQLMKNTVDRDRLGLELGAKCVEMEAAGLMNDFPCIVIRGICDYADAHKNDIWQKYAAVTAAAYAKKLLSIVKPAEVDTVEHATMVTKAAVSTKTKPASQSCPQYITYRVRDIPDVLDKASLRKALISSLSSLDCHKGLILEVCSLAPDPHQGTRKIATCSSNRTSSNCILQGSRYLERTISFNGQQEIVTIDKDFYGITPLNSEVPSSGYNIDILAIHGLAGNAFSSFKQSDTNYMWLRDKLTTLLPMARVMTYGYNVEINSSKSFQGLRHIGETFHRELKRLLGSIRQRPMILVGHSLGGLVIKETICEMNRHRESAQLLKSIRGILFFGVPHLGLEATDLISILQGHLNEDLIRELRPNSNTLSILHREYARAFPFKEALVYSFFETECSSTAVEENGQIELTGTPKILVTEASATHGRNGEEQAPPFTHAFGRSHNELVKFPRVGDSYSSSVFTALQNINSQRLMFYHLKHNADYLKPCQGNAWGHLTRKSMGIYRQVYKSCRDEDGFVECMYDSIEKELSILATVFSALPQAKFFIATTTFQLTYQNYSAVSHFREQMRPSDPSLKALQDVWLRVAKTLSTRVSRHAAMTILYMLHVERYINVPHYPKLHLVSKRFDCWVQCRCDDRCNGWWNFTNGYGMITIKENSRCHLLTLLNGDKKEKSKVERRKPHLAETVRAWEENDVYRIPEISQLG